MEAKRWTLGVVLAAAVSLFGLVQADASPFSTYILSDDLGNSVSGTVPEASSWEDEAGSQNGTDDHNGNRDDTGGSNEDADSTDSGNNGHGNNADGVDSSNPGGGKDNNGHGNNEDGVDSSNPGQGSGGPNGAEDASCLDPDNCVDDEVKGGGDSGDSGKGRGKKK